jgi:hypothetical protein
MHVYQGIGSQSGQQTVALWSNREKAGEGTEFVVDYQQNLPCSLTACKRGHIDILFPKILWVDGDVLAKGAAPRLVMA